MKQKIFTLVMMLALVVVAGSAFGQGTKNAPENNSLHNYSWTNIVPNTATSTFYVTNADPATVPTVSSTATNNYTIGTIVATGDNRSIDITWLNGSVGVDYYVWIQVTNGTCSNYRYYHVRPVAAVEFALYSQGIGDGSATDVVFTGTSTTYESCPVPVGATYAEGSATPGHTYAYFKVVRTNGMGGTWTFSFDDGITALGVEGSTSPTSGYGTIPASIGAAVNTYYIRVDVTVPTGATNLAINGSISGATEGSYADVTNDDDNATITVDAIPSIGAFN